MKKICNLHKMLYSSLLALTLLLISCNPQGPETIEDLDLISTAFSKGFNFSAVKTYYMPNRVVLISDPSNQNSNTQIDSTFNQIILSQIESNFSSLGYTRLDTITDAQKPDVLVQVAALATTNTNIYYDNWWDYWSGYYSPYYPGYSYGWSPYPRYYAYSYDTGTVIIEMLNPNNATGNQKTIPSVWVASFNGLLSGSNANLQNRIVSGINQAFKQSPYL